MRTAPRPGKPTSVLSLTIEVTDNRPDWPVVGIRVDGRNPFADVAAAWRGFDPEAILGPPSPLLPREPFGRRVAVYCCSCGEAGCGVIAPRILGSPDHARVSWTDFRDYTGVFNGPADGDVLDCDGRPWKLPDIHFDYGQYLAEVNRPSNDLSWETPRRRTARLVKQRIAPMNLTLPPDLTLSWVSPAWSDEGVTVMFSSGGPGDHPSSRQQALQLTSPCVEPDAAADDMVDHLLSTSPRDWVATFG